jgi:hypothetical protein
MSVASDVVRFPPLPHMPEPPVVGPDARQTAFLGIVGRLSEAIAEHGHIQATNLATGYHASAPAVGIVKSAHEQALTHFDMRNVHDRWEEDLGRWLSNSLIRWFQRTKRVSTKLYPNGIAVEIETQDDHGYYRYGFDIMIREAPVA